MKENYKELLKERRKKYLQERRKYYYPQSKNRNIARKLRTRKENYEIKKIVPYNELVIYTSLYGNYDNLKPQIPFENVHYVCFSDQDIKPSYNWQVIVQDEALIEQPSVMRAKYFKILPFDLFSNADYTIYIDASIQIIHNDFVQIMLNYLTDDNSFAIYTHPKRKCIYEEYERLKNIHTKNFNMLDEQIEFYKEEKMPSNYGLWAGGTIIRKKTENSEKICQFWWDELVKWSYRDQISLPYVLWKNNLKVDTIFLKQYAGQLFKIHQHTADIERRR